MGGHPAAVRHRINRVGNDPAIAEFLYGGGWNDGVSDPLLDVHAGLRRHLKSQVQSVLDQFTDRGPTPYLLCRELVDFHVTLVPDDDFALVLEDDQSERHIV